MVNNVSLGRRGDAGATETERQALGPWISTITGVPGCPRKSVLPTLKYRLSPTSNVSWSLSELALSDYLLHSQLVQFFICVFHLSFVVHCRGGKGGEGFAVVGPPLTRSVLYSTCVTFTSSQSTNSALRHVQPTGDSPKMQQTRRNNV